jgi:CBS domain containing-hemolysin-like protein
MDLLQNLNAYLSACQLGITLASLGLGWVGEPAVARLLEQPLSGFSDAWRHGIAFAIAFSIITSLHIVIGEQAPKLVGLALAEKVALAIALPLQLFYKVFQPAHSRARLGQRPLGSIARHQSHCRTRIHLH